MAPDNRLECPKEGSLSPAGHRGRERSWEGSPQEAATKEMYSPKRFQGGGGDTFHGDAGRGSRRGWQREGQQWHPRLPGFPPPKKRGRVGGTGKVKPGKCCCKTGKVKPGKCCCKNKAGLWKVDPDTQAQEQERKRRHSGPQQEKT